MQNIINPGLAYIEQNLKTDITVEELAGTAGYSVWHYYRLFAQTTGLSVAAYIVKRRLECALSEIAGGRKAIDTVLEYGFDTYAGFYKAFVKVYGCSPKKYLLLQKQSKTEGITMNIQSILTNWDIPRDLPISDIYIMDGAKVSGNVWRVGEDYILKTGERSALLKNLKIAKALTSQGFNAPIAIPTKSGEEYLDGENITVLTKGVKGEPLPKSDRFGANRKEFGYKYGQSIAKLHNALSEMESDLQPYEQNLFPHVTEWALPETKKQNEQYNMGLPDSVFDDYVSNFGTLFEKLPKQLIHRDPNPSNILFDNGDVSGFIDFDLSERNVRLWDPCYCATGILSETSGVDYSREKWLDMLEGILQGYDSVNPLTAEEKQSVFYVICSIEMICAAYFESVDVYKPQAETNRGMFRFITANETKIRGIFK
ncbi:MAG: helix-turn-helix domain-containing protein [Oscillospiraceae bacterium]|nr:helix-turn-helix domain-containing protein [Oscillospiraceae bacterium]